MMALLVTAQVHIASLPFWSCKMGHRTANCTNLCSKILHLRPFWAVQHGLCCSGGWVLAWSSIMSHGISCKLLSNIIVIVVIIMVMININISININITISLLLLGVLVIIYFYNNYYLP